MVPGVKRLNSLEIGGLLLSVGLRVRLGLLCLSVCLSVDSLLVALIIKVWLLEIKKTVFLI